MSHHTPEDLRRILLLLKGKKNLGKNLRKHVAKGHGKVSSGGWDYETGGYNFPRVLDRDRIPAEERTIFSSEDPSSTRELLQMLQLLDAGFQGGDRLRGLLKEPVRGKITSRDSLAPGNAKSPRLKAIRDKIDRLPINTIPF